MRALVFDEDEVTLEDDLLPSERRLVIRQGNSLAYFPWVRHALGSNAREPGILAYMAVKPGCCIRRMVWVNDTDFTEDNLYRVCGDCPYEAILPASFVPGRRPVRAYPAHPVLSNLWALGVRIQLDDEERLVWHDHTPVHLQAMVRGMFAAMDTETLDACRLWIASYWNAPETVRDRWIAKYDGIFHAAIQNAAFVRKLSGCLGFRSWSKSLR